MDEFPAGDVDAGIGEKSSVERPKTCDLLLETPRSCSVSCFFHIDVSSFSICVLKFYDLAVGLSKPVSEKLFKSEKFVRRYTHFCV